MDKLKDTTLFKNRCYINGKWCNADNNENINVYNPATDEKIGTVPCCAEIETKRAIDAAHAAWDTWKSMTAKERGRLIMAWYELIQANVDDLARIMTIEQGKPLADAAGEIATNSEQLAWSAVEGQRMYGEVIPAPRGGMHPYTHWQPLGVVYAVTPWNFPAGMIFRKAGPALAAGCTMVIKPASSTPYSALAMIELAHRAGIPAGVLNVVTGNARRMSKVAADDPRVRKITFTGSTEVGKELMALASGTVKRVSLELGGNAPFVVFDDADLDAAADACLVIKYRNAGQMCICANRILVQRGVVDAFTQKLAERVKTLVVGNGLDAGVTLGPLVNKEAVQHAEELVQDAVANGGKIVIGGKRHALGATYFEPTVIANATPDMRAFKEEIFAPVAPVFTFDTEEEGIRLANDTQYGLAAYAWTSNIGRAFRLANKLESGMVGINTCAVAFAEGPFGGAKESGMGREGGHQNLRDYMDLRLVNFGGLD